MNRSAPEGQPSRRPVGSQTERPRKRWDIKSLPPADLSWADVHPVVAAILYGRGVRTEAECRALLFDDPALEGDPFQLADLAAAVERIESALERRETIAVYGDYDVDGIAGTALLTEGLRALGARVRPYIPHRIGEGYGLNRQALESLAGEDIRLVITVDCGTSSVDEVRHAGAIGLDVIVCDHHALTDQLPRAIAAINPKRTDSAYPFRELCAAGVAYKLLQAVVASRQARPGAPADCDPRDMLDLVALATIADMVPLVGENRKLVRDGLALLREGRRPGIRALASSARTDLARLDSTTVGFVIAPRLNAAGRLDTALTSLNLLLTREVNEALQLAESLEQINRERQRITEQCLQRARVLVLAEERDHPILFVGDPGYPQGIVGLVAGRLSEEFGRPAFVYEQGAEESRGSARSGIPTFNVVEALSSTEDILVRYGGHAAAAGFTIRTKLLPELRRRLLVHAEERLDGVDLRPVLRVDAEVQLDQIDWGLKQQIDALAPFGFGNPLPRLMSRRTLVREARVVGTNHLRMVVQDQAGGLWGAIAFRQADRLRDVQHTIDLVYALDVNEWNGRVSLQLVVQDLRPAE